MGGAVASVDRPERTIQAQADQGTTEPVDFALIGHQESWRAAADVLAVLRGPDRMHLPDDEVKDILPWIPPRAVCHVEVGSILPTKIDGPTGATAHGLYIDSFIPPDRLEAAHVHENIARVRGAAACAIRAGARIVSLGGFSSILIEGNFDQLPERRDTVFTTGNTLTVGFIVQGMKKMCVLEGRDLRKSTLLIVGATGDVGSGCARCLAPLVKRVLLSARNLERLRRLAAELRTDEVQVEIATDCLENNLQRFSAEADLVICAASLASPSLLLGRIAPQAIVCDSGYPKNLSPNAQMPGAKIFFGGLGQITGGLRFRPDFHGILNRHPFPDVVHGCLLEGMALALAGRFEPFSQGRGFITQKRVEEMETIAAGQGIYLAPLYNADGPLGDGLHCQTEWSRACEDGLMEQAEVPSARTAKTAKTERMARIGVS
jgi:fatty aldehyde-generating acyl-ACP reductase